MRSTPVIDDVEIPWSPTLDEQLKNILRKYPKNSTGQYPQETWDSIRLEWNKTVESDPRRSSLGVQNSDKLRSRQNSWICDIRDYQNNEARLWIPRLNFEWTPELDVWLHEILLS